MEMPALCPSCGKQFLLDLKLSGKKGRCGQCKQEFVIRFQAAAPDQPSPLPPPRAATPPGRPKPAMAETQNDMGHSSPARASDDLYALDEPVIPDPAPVARPGPPASPGRAPLSATGRPAEPVKAWDARKIRTLAGGGIAAAVMFVAVKMIIGGLFPGKVEPAPEGAEPAVEVAHAPAVSPPAPARDAAESGGVAAVREPEIDAGEGPAATAPKASRPRPDKPLETTELVARCEPSVALIRGKQSGGTGFVIAPRIVATNAHVIRGEVISSIEVRFPSAEKSRQGPYHAKLLHRDEGKDLAFLAVETDLPALDVAESVTFRKGDDVTVIGNPGVGANLMLENAISRGIVSSMAKIDGRELLQLGISVNPGNSGGPVLDSRGSVIGVIKSRARQEGIAFCIPAQEFRPALELAIAAAKDPGAVAKGGPPGTASRDEGVGGLQYGWKPGQTYVYAVELSIEAGSLTVNLEGTSIYRAKSDDEEGVSFRHQSWVTMRIRDKAGRLTAGGMSGPSIKSGAELKVDRSGNVLSASGATPVPLLGDLALLVIEPFPDSPQATWEDAKSITLNEVEKVPGEQGGMPRLGRPDLRGMPIGPRQRLGSARQRSNARNAPQQKPQQPPSQVKVTVHPAEERTTYALGAPDGDEIPIAKTYELVTQDGDGNKPSFKMTGTGTMSFDRKAGVASRVDFKAMVVANGDNVTVRIPMKLRCRLLSGIEAELRPADPGHAPDSHESHRHRHAQEGGGRAWYQRRQPPPQSVSDVVRILRRSRTGGRASRGPWNACSRAATRAFAARSFALGLWGDAKSIEALVMLLDDPSSVARDELFEALGRITPSEVAATAVARTLEKEGERASRTLRAMGSIAEKPVLEVLRGSDPKAALLACRVLKEIGGGESIPALESLAALKDAVEVGRIADEAIKAIHRRHPGDDDWAAIEQDARADDARHRRQAAERLQSISPIKERRAAVIKLLETLAADQDGGVQGTAVKALARWDDGSARAFWLGLLADPRLRPFGEVMEVARKMTPKDRELAEGVARAYKRDRRIVTEILASIGPAAEPAVLQLLDGESDRVAVRDLIRHLGSSGTNAALPALRELAQKDGPARGDAQRAIAQIESRAGDSGQDVAAILANLKGSDRGRRNETLNRLANMSPEGQPRRAEVTRVLESFLEDLDVFSSGPAMKAIAAWGDEKTAALLADRLEHGDPRDWKETLQALAALRPDARTAGLAAGCFPRDARFVLQVLRSNDIPCDAPLLALIKSGADKDARLSACRALGEVGTPRSIPDLQSLAVAAGNEGLSREAEDAVKTIQSRQ